MFRTTALGSARRITQADAFASTQMDGCRRQGLCPPERFRKFGPAKGSADMSSKVLCSVTAYAAQIAELAGQIDDAVFVHRNR